MSWIDWERRDGGRGGKLNVLKICGPSVVYKPVSDGDQLAFFFFFSSLPCLPVAVEDNVVGSSVNVKIHY